MPLLLESYRGSRLVWISLLLVGFISLFAFADWWIGLPDNVERSYVGSQSCIDCHQAEFNKWRGSHHDLAMDKASSETVLGDFNNAEISQFGQTTRMFRAGSKYMVHTEGPDGKMADFEVKYVLGVTPLQQYMVEFDRTEGQPENEIARLQVLRMSWDTERKRWFYLPPPDVKEKLAPDDDLHWTGIAQRWNTMCADCHSTNLKKNYNAQTGIYHTSYSEIDVSCEACHGPASVHVQLARSMSPFWDRKHGYGLAKLKGESNEPQIQACAPCHSRRRVLYPDFHPGASFHDHYAAELLNPLTYHPDGQVLDEVYEYGSFIQSKMYHKGIRCSDCHDPHSARLKHEGNRVCTSCHAHSPGKYDNPSHHRHQPGSRGSLCVECHMPESTYMEVDARRDHSLRIPRPDLSLKLGTPNACTKCHLHSQPGLEPMGELLAGNSPAPEKLASATPQSATPTSATPTSATPTSTSRLVAADSLTGNPTELATPEQLQEYQKLVADAQRDDTIRKQLTRIDVWCAEAMIKWYGSKVRDRHFGEILHAARRSRSESVDELFQLARDQRYPAVARATAAMELGQSTSPAALRASMELRNDRDPQIRAAAIANLEGMGLEVVRDNAVPLLSDPSRVVRSEAARILAALPWQELRAKDRELLKSAAEEFRAGLMETNDRAAAYLPLGVLYERAGNDAAAQAAYETAIRVEPRATGPRSNLAALFDRQAQERERTIQQLVRTRNETQATVEIEALTSLQQKINVLREEELVLLERDARLVPENAPVHYRLGLALYLQGKLEKAEVHLRQARRLEPQAPDFALALALLFQKLNRMDEAHAEVLALISLRPDDASYRELESEIRQSREASKKKK